MMKKEISSRLEEKISRLSPEKRKLLAAKLRQKRQGVGEEIEITRGRRNIAPLSFPQQRFWFLNQLEPNLSVYNEWTAISLIGALDIKSLKKAIAFIVQRHEILRTNFILRDGQPYQQVNNNINVSLDIIDLLPLPKAERRDEALRLAKIETQAHFDLAHESLYRVKLFKLDEQEYILLQVFHHIVIDAWSATILYRELGFLYTAFSQNQLAELPELPVQYTDFTVWQQQCSQSQKINKQLHYWKKQLADLSPLPLATDRPRGVRQTYKGAQLPITISTDLLQSLKQLSQRSGASLFMTLLAAFQTLLYRYTGQEDVVVGSPTANRDHPNIEKLIGCFTNTLVLRSDFSEGLSFRELLSQVRETVLDALAHQALPFEKLVEAIHPERDLSRTPLFQVMLVYNNTAMNVDQFGRMQAVPVDIESTIARFDLTLSIMELDAGLTGYLIYNADLFESATIARMVGHFETLLAGIVEAPDQSVDVLPLLKPTEREQLLFGWNHMGASSSEDKLIHQLFEEQVERTPNAIAVVFATNRMTYQELNSQANKLAHYLQKLGVAPEVRVGLCTERSIELVVVLLAILKAGGSYVPFDPEYPSERVAFMLKDSKPLVLLTQKKLLPSLPKTSVQIICLDECCDIIGQQNTDNPVSGVTASNLAYILYTSGSTGHPKGVEIEHHSPVALINWTLEVFSSHDIAGVLASTSICFDLSVFELFVPLSRGGKVILSKNALHLPTLDAVEEVTLINTVPSAIAELLRNNAVPCGVKVVNLAGEPLKNKLVQQVYAQTQTEKVFNLYGPSEDTTYSTFSLIARGADSEPTIGRPIVNTQTYILGAKQEPVPMGVVGELYLGGCGVARGYRNQHKLTTEKFILNPFDHTRRSHLYATGDLARYLPDGNIEFLGRKDHQVKLRGFRIELGEIEIVINQHPAVQEAIVIVREDIANDQRLLAYIVSHADSEGISNSALRAYLQQYLPAYMIPAGFVLLDALPLTPNGKVDRRALPELATEHLSAAIFEPPSTETEQQLVDIWKQILGMTKIGIHDNFFEIGGHSLLATQVVNQCCVTFQIELALLSLFEESSVAQLAAHIDHIKLAQELQESKRLLNQAHDEIII